MSATDTATLWTALEALARPTLSELFADPARLDRYATVLDLPGGPINPPDSATTPPKRDSPTATA